MGITRVFSIMVFVVAAVFAILLGFIPIFGALVRSIPVSVQGGIEMYLFGLIAVIGGKIWVDAKVDFSKRANLAVAAIPLIIAAGIPATQAIPIHLGGMACASRRVRSLVDCRALASCRETALPSTRRTRCIGSSRISASSVPAPASC